ncbi:MAG: hypothetical protein ABIT96_11615 [Ferruginibacter sp.]
MKIVILLALSIIILPGCKNEKNSQQTFLSKEWYEGKAEIASYDLTQARYGELRKGESVLIFVTEDMSSTKLVKLDSTAADAVPVLKMNFTKKFNTGIYPYSMMLSVFTPVSSGGNERTLKASCSVQEWCGHAFSQIRLDGDSYHWQLHSYFEKESEQDNSFSASFLEDEIWTRIRINPETLPQGKIAVVPGLFWQRFSHGVLKATEAVASRTAADSFFIKDSAAQMYTLHFPEIQRTLQVYYEAAPPHKILGWQESYPDTFSSTGGILTTTATRKKSIWLDYWKHNHLSDSTYRTLLDLPLDAR